MEVGQDVRVAVGVGPMAFQLNNTLHLAGDVIANSHRPTSYNSTIELSRVGVGRCEISDRFTASKTFNSYMFLIF